MGTAAAALARAFVVLTILAGIGFSVQGAIRLEADTRQDARPKAWSSSEDDRMRSALVGWYAVVDGVRRSTPQRAVIWCWTSTPTTDSVLADLIEVLESALAPRLTFLVLSTESVDKWQPRLSSSGRPTYFLELHP